MCLYTGGGRRGWGSDPNQGVQARTDRLKAAGEFRIMIISLSLNAGHPHEGVEESHSTKIEIRCMENPNDKRIGLSVTLKGSYERDVEHVVHRTTMELVAIDPRVAGSSISVEIVFILDLYSSYEIHSDVTGVHDLKTSMLVSYMSQASLRVKASSIAIHAPSELNPNSFSDVTPIRKLEPREGSSTWLTPMSSPLIHFCRFIGFQHPDHWFLGQHYVVILIDMLVKREDLHGVTNV
ncbi:hypothetical protein BDN72DRAFT_860277 [Pluteus cervinus]|uniref:Uncharacterized protein n=1 Tax=Pluteus cervinus TaxID=181527 RepID=A0ACD3AJM7_9AGAR|nr:hypothetical protein BDN72DRAFT_860277 [Pluteus cervinus]